MATSNYVEEDMSDELFLQILTRISTASNYRSDARFTYVIGNNGAGKSRLLASLAAHLAEAASKPKVACLSSSLYDRFELRYDGNVRYLGARNPANAVFHARVDRSLSEMILAAMQRNRRSLSELERVLETSLYMKLSVPINRQGNQVLFHLFDARKFRGRKFEEVFTLGDRRLLAQIAGRTLPFRGLDRKQIDLLAKVMKFNGNVELYTQRRGGEMLRFNQLSSGEQNRTLLFAKVVSVAEEGVSILIDEPEISLHLQWQWDFHEKLASLLSSLKHVHVVIATHAPVVISEAARSDPNSESNMVIVMDRLTTRNGAAGFGEHHRVKYKQHCFAEVASHERLVLRYFETSTYNSQAVSMEIASALLEAVETTNPLHVIKLLEELLNSKGMKGDSEVSIKSAITLLKNGVINKLNPKNRDEIPLH